MPNDALKTAWRELQEAGDAMGATRLRALFETDPGRFERYSLEAAGLFLDYSKNKITDDAVEKLLALANAVGLSQAREAMFAGQAINETEGRAVLHVALRDFTDRAYMVDGDNVSGVIAAEREKIKTFCDQVHSGALTGHTGKTLEHVVNIGIGGSDLGPLMAVEALRPYWLEGRRAHFVSNVDGQHLVDTLDGLDPEKTFFVVASKTFTTQETLTNAHSARDWFLASGAPESAIASHFIALSTNAEAVTEFGIRPENMFVFWDWVGGRYSMWSAIGMSIALQVGYANFEKMLAGAAQMDRHFEQAPLAENMPVMLALAGIWNRNALGVKAHAVLPYDQHLHRLAAYLQQADMESNGKSVRLNGEPIDTETGPIIFGEPGTNGQHAFYQLLHQGTDIVSADFIAAAVSQSERGDHHAKLLSNFIAQTEALMRGRTLEEARDELTAQGNSAETVERLAPHKVFPGDRPSNSIMMEKLTPETLGALIALYEHKIFCQGVIWGINSFDQWGVELGKTLAKNVLPELSVNGETKPPTDGHDASTNGLIERVNKVRERAV
ncbi:MAG: glucose-6-phosphate isomerase [Pseudomonadota bacterium]